jgi:HEPN domain-containing protein
MRYNGRKAGAAWEGGDNVNRSDLQKLAAERIADARALLSQKRWAGAYYLAGYAVECGLKACIAKRMMAEEFPDKSFADKCWTHDLGRLVTVADLKTARDAAAAAHPDFSNNWITVKDWDESRRYVRMGKVKAEELYEAITDKKHGVLQWIRFHW